MVAMQLFVSVITNEYEPAVNPFMSKVFPITEDPSDHSICMTPLPPLTEMPVMLPFDSLQVVFSIAKEFKSRDGPSKSDKENGPAVDTQLFASITVKV